MDRPGAKQSELRVGRVAVARSTPDYAALTVMNTILGGATGFVAVMFGLVAVASFFVFPPGRRTLVAPAAAWTPLALGSVVLGLQALGMFFALAMHESATVVNVVYSSRALWSVVLAWLLARWLQGEERRDPAAALRRRLLGSALIFAAVVVVLL